MKKIYNLICILVIQLIAINISYAQNIQSIKLLGEKDSIVIEYAHILLDEKLVTYSDESGNFNINLNLNFNVLTIKHLSFKSKEIEKHDLKTINIVFLMEKENLLKEVVISSKNKPKKHLLLPDKSKKEFFMKGLDVRFPYDFINAVYVPNDLKKGKYSIENILFEARKGSDDSNGKFIPFKINLMTVDSISHLPKNKIFEEELTVGKKENQKLLKVDLSGYNIEFPKEGIFVIVSLYEQQYYESNGFTDRPGFGQTQISKKSNFFELFWKPGKNRWEEPLYSQERIQCRNFGLEVVEY